MEIQRTRILTAMVEECSERGAGNVTVAHLVARAGISRRTFYELYSSREACFLGAFDEAVARGSEYVLDAYDLELKWAARLRMALVSLLAFLDIERGLGELLIVGSLGSGPNALERRQRVLAQIVAILDEGRTESKGAEGPPPLTAEGVVGGVLSILHSRLLEGDDSLLALTNPLMSMIVLPYLGPAAARRELTRPVPKSRTVGRAASGDPLREVGMRLTYRTARVLMSVAAAPGASNREIGLGAGMEDQGQISKLLARLQRLELIHNTRSAAARGAPNAWGLTEQGWRVQRAIAGQGARG
ncbi:MAG TPA: TetR family transcriptional regulator [Solirubrobacteraceae bacterium]|nr:TetR family transcriptional regulator [Solirubrobacteraceae bacterium]